FYDTFETKDGEHVSIGSIEPQFYAQLLKLTGLDAEDLPRQMDRTQWDASKEKVTAVFKTKTRAEWNEIMEGTDVCYAPVLSMSEAYEHPHNVARKTFVEVAGVPQPAPAPRFSRTEPEISRPPSHPGQHTDEVLTAWGLSAEDLARLRNAKAIA
ncbi:MAG: CoA transferase, partial [Myxococcales bacterium]|nr:CoA transferase [Myxococcales bacterium]